MSGSAVRYREAIDRTLKLDGAMAAAISKLTVMNDTLHSEGRSQSQSESWKERSGRRISGSSNDSNICWYHRTYLRIKQLNIRFHAFFQLKKTSFAESLDSSYPMRSTPLPYNL